MKHLFLKLKPIKVENKDYNIDYLKNVIERFPNDIKKEEYGLFIYINILFSRCYELNIRIDFLKFIISKNEEFEKIEEGESLCFLADIYAELSYLTKDKQLFEYSIKLWNESKSKYKYIHYIFYLYYWKIISNEQEILDEIKKIKIYVKNILEDEKIIDKIKNDPTLFYWFNDSLLIINNII